MKAGETVCAIGNAVADADAVEAMMDLKQSQHVPGPDAIKLDTETMEDSRPDGNTEVGGSSSASSEYSNTVLFAAIAVTLIALVAGEAVAKRIILRRREARRSWGRSSMKKFSDDAVSTSASETMTEQEGTDAIPTSSSPRSEGGARDAGEERRRRFVDQQQAAIDKANREQAEREEVLRREKEERRVEAEKRRALERQKKAEEEEMRAKAAEERRLLREKDAEERRIVREKEAEKARFELAKRIEDEALAGRQVELYCKMVDASSSGAMGADGRKGLPSARISDSVAQLKVHIERVSQVPAVEQVLIINGKILTDDDAAVASYVSLTSGGGAPVLMSHEVCVMVLRKKKN